ncbi:hypothetical protein BV25DRAFT_1820677 [Artomyces pyxidatus]|uniref:Uncharacterized protein n=1 Tax=Artomyces pyxidatus TaxID=48021 RepID=A0ACB8TDY7_9AGAM|nr:hypothetical protein BV25DRAFT_1820677 [Artomyces pyxidatus]
MAHDWHDCHCAKLVPTLSHIAVQRLLVLGFQNLTEPTVAGRKWRVIGTLSTF